MVLAYSSLLFEVTATVMISFGVLARGAFIRIEPNTGLAKRYNQLQCSMPGKSIGTHCAFFDDDGYSFAPTGSDGQYICQAYNDNGQGIYQCQYHNEESVMLACDTKDASQLQANFGLEKSYVSGVQGKFIKWYWESEANAGTYAGNETTYFTDDNINIQCTGSHY